MIVVKGGTSLPDRLFKGEIEEEQKYFFRVSWWSRVDMWRSRRGNTSLEIQ